MARYITQKELEMAYRLKLKADAFANAWHRRQESLIHRAKSGDLFARDGRYKAKLQTKRERQVNWRVSLIQRLGQETARRILEKAPIKVSARLVIQPQMTVEVS